MPEQSSVRSKTIRDSNTWVQSLAAARKALAASKIRLAALHAMLQSQAMRGQDWSLHHLARLMRQIRSTWKSSEIPAHVLKARRKLDAGSLFPSAIDQLQRSANLAAPYVPYLRL